MGVALETLVTNCYGLFIFSLPKFNICSINCFSLMTDWWPNNIMAIGVGPRACNVFLSIRTPKFARYYCTASGLNYFSFISQKHLFMISIAPVAVTSNTFHQFLHLTISEPYYNSGGIRLIRIIFHKLVHGRNEILAALMHARLSFYKISQFHFHCPSFIQLPNNASMAQSYQILEEMGRRWLK